MISFGRLTVAAAALLGTLVLIVAASPAIAAPPCEVDSESPICGGDPPEPATGDPWGGLDKDAWGFTPTSGHITGWTADPDAGRESIDIRVDVFTYDWVLGWTSYTVMGRANVARQTGIAGNHGLDVYVPPQWLASACVTAVNVGPGADVSLGCVGLYFNS